MTLPLRVEPHPMRNWPIASIPLLPRTAVGLMVLVSLGCGLPARAQLVNDPAETIIFNGNSRFAPVEKDKLQEKISVETEKASGKKNETAKVEPLPSELQPEMDVQDSQTTEALPPPPPADDALQAKAVIVDINSNTLNYDKDRDVYVATGAVHMVISEQNSELYADRLVFDQNQDLVIAEGSVTIIKAGQKTHGSYAKIDLVRKSALINDATTTVSAVRVKAKQYFVSHDGIEMENGRMIISGALYRKMANAGGLGNLGQTTGKRANQARLNRAYSKRVVDNREMFNQLSIDQQMMLRNVNAKKSDAEQFDESKGAVSHLNMRVKELEVVRNEDGYDEITMKRPSLYWNKFKLFGFPDTDFSYDQEAQQIQYLGPDIGSNRSYGGLYAGPGWDFHVGRGSLRVSPVASYGSPGFWSSNGKDGKNISAGPGVGGVLHFRDPDTTLDLAYNSRVGSPVMFLDRRIYGDNTHFMASVNDFYNNGLLGQRERPNYIAQITDYRVLKEYKNFQLTSFESLGYARDNFYPNFKDTYFVESKGRQLQTLGRAQLQFQVQNVAPLLRIGKYGSVGMRAQLISSAYSSGDFAGLARIGPTMNLNLLGSRLQSSLGFTLSHSVGESPFVFDSYYGGSQNFSMNNLFRVNKYLSVGTSNSFALKRDNARGALAVGNSVYMMVGPQDVKATIGYDVVNGRSYFGINYYPGASNTVINFDKLRMMQPSAYAPPPI
ncbi:MAG TPA: hypothetical protein V6C52_09755 [Coleofasciculaceae cyanobacterium]